eukprot:564697-Rhodomonas_salina.1
MEDIASTDLSSVDSQRIDTDSIESGSEMLLWSSPSGRSNEMGQARVQAEREKGRARFQRLT